MADSLYTGREGVPQDVDVLMDIRDSVKKVSNNLGGATTVTADTVGEVLADAYKVAAPNGVKWSDL